MFDFTRGKPLPDWGLFGVYRRFTRVSIQMTSWCCNACVFCPIPELKIQRKTMTMDDLALVLRALPDFDGEVMISLNGEAFILEDLPERCALIKRHWPKSTIILISTFNIDHGPEHIQRLFASGLDSLQISCYGHTEEDYAALHGSRAFSALCRNLLHLKALSDCMQKKVRILLLPDTADAFSLVNAREKERDFLRYAAECGIQYAESGKLHSWQGRIRQGSKLVPPFPCTVVWGSKARHLNIGVNLDVLPCCYFPDSEFSFGNLRESSLEKIFDSPVYGEFYQNHWEGRLKGIPVCDTCTLVHNSASTDECMRFAAFTGRRLAGKPVYFWGAGEAYRKFNAFFHDTKPQAILLDDIADRPAFVDSIPVKYPHEVLSSGAVLPVVLFAQAPNNINILNRVQEHHPEYESGNIIPCPANFETVKKEFSLREL